MTRIVGVNRWRCSITHKKAVSVTMHPTKEAAEKKQLELEQLRLSGKFVGIYGKPPKPNKFTFGHCEVERAEEGVRCDGVISCKEYSKCLKEAFQYNLKGWRVLNTNDTII